LPSAAGFEGDPDQRPGVKKSGPRWAAVEPEKSI